MNIDIGNFNKKLYVDNSNQVKNHSHVRKHIFSYTILSTRNELLTKCTPIALHKNQKEFFNRVLYIYLRKQLPISSGAINIVHKIISFGISFLEWQHFKPKCPKSPFKLCSFLSKLKWVV